jgi:hypothetical protein
MATKNKSKKAAKAKPSKSAKTRKALSTAKALKKTLSPVAVGAVVSGTDPCTCGDSTEEHGRDSAHPGSTACTVEGCGCIAYEADRGFNEDE